MIQKIFFPSDGLTLAGNLEIVPHASLGILILHGGGTSSKDRFTFLQEIFALHGWSSLAIDFRGVGESEGKFEEGSLANRLMDATNAYEVLKKHVTKVAVLGTSMGGHVAARLTEKEDVAALLLLYAAAYGKDAENKLLNEELTKSIREPNNWVDSLAFSAVANFHHPVLMVYGDKDVVVPEDVREKYKNAAQNGKFVNIPNGTHLLFSMNTEEEKAIRSNVIEEITTFLQGVDTKSI